MNIPSLTHVRSFLGKLFSTEQSTSQQGFFPFLVPVAIAICVLAMVAVGFALGQIDKVRTYQQNQQQSMQLRKAIVEEITLLVQNQTAFLESAAQDPALAQLFAAGDEVALTARAHELAYLFPGALRVRLLRLGTNQTDEDAQPPMGYAALALLREVEAGRVPPAEIQLPINGKRNIAIVRAVFDPTDKHLLGHILGQFSPDSLFRMLDVASQGGNLVALTQEVGTHDVTVYHKGNAQEETNTSDRTRQNISGTRWHLAYQLNPLGDQEIGQNPWINRLLVALAVLVTSILLGVQFIFRKSLQQDVTTLISVMQDLREGRPRLQYILRLGALARVLDAMRQQPTPTTPPPSQIPSAPKRVIQPPPVLKPPAAVPPAPPDVFATPPAQLIPVPAPVIPPAELIAPPSITPAPPSPPSPPPIPTTTPPVAGADIALAIVSEPAPALPASTPAPMVATPVVTPSTTATSESAVPVAAAVPPAPPPLTLLDLDEIPPLPAVSETPAPQKTTPPSVRSTPEAALELSFLDGGLPSGAPANKSTVTLPSTPASSSSSPQATLTILEPKSAPSKGISLTIETPTTPAATAIHPHLPSDIFRAYEIRGVAEHSLTIGGIHEIGRSIGSEAQERGQPRVVVARDGRVSGVMLSKALIDGLRATGCEVIDIGQVPTPVLYFATHLLETHAGVMLTASHHPPQCNGLKVVLQGEILAGEAIQQLHKRIEAGRLTTGAGSLQTRDVVPEYLNQMTAGIHLQRPLRLVVDGGNGVAGALAPQLYRALGCEVSELFCEVDGNFPNRLPDPSQPSQLRALIQTVKTQQADLGIAFDGDGDRMIVVDGSGAIIWPDQLMMLLTSSILSRNPGATIIFDVKSSARLAQMIKKHGGKPLMWKTGHSFIRAKMRETGAIFAGEMSGYLFFKDTAFNDEARGFVFDDGLYAGVRLLEVLSRDERPPHVIFAEQHSATSTPELRLDLPKGENGRIMDALDKTRARLSGATITRIDGLRADFGEGWGLVRASNTTPSLVFRFEAQTPQALRRIQDEFRRILLEAGPGLKLPF